MIVSAEELAAALDTHVDFARAVLERVRAIQRREPYLPPLPARELAERANRLALVPERCPARVAESNFTRRMKLHGIEA